MSFSLKGELFLGISKARAASLQTNLDLAKNVVESINVDLPNQSVEPAPTTFTTDGFLAKPLLAETVVTKEENTVKKTSTVKKSPTINVKTTIVSTQSTGNHFFPYGYCTYYVSERRDIPWSGNAISWLSGARSFGFQTGNTPQVGAIIVTSEGGATGHVGMVDGVNGDQIMITEMNYRGFGVISQRTISASYGAILGYIY